LFLFFVLKMKNIFQCVSTSQNNSFLLSSFKVIFSPLQSSTPQICENCNKISHIIRKKYTLNRITIFLFNKRMISDFLNNLMPYINHFWQWEYLMIFVIALLESFIFTSFFIPWSTVIFLISLFSVQDWLDIRMIFLSSYLKYFEL